MDKGVDNHALELNEEGPPEPAKAQAETVEDIVEEILQEDEDEEGPVHFEDLEFEPNFITNLQDRVDGLVQLIKKRLGTKDVLIKQLPIFIVILLYHVFFFGALHHYRVGEKSIEWCDGFGCLIIITIIVYLFVINAKVVKPLIRTWLQSDSGAKFQTRVGQPIISGLNRLFGHRFATFISGCILFGLVLIYLLIDTAGSRERMISGFGLLVLLFLGFIFSAHPGRVVWRHILWGVGLQFVFGLLILRWDVGRSIFQCLGDKISTFLGYTDEGSKFVFGSLVSQEAFWTFTLNKSSVAYEVATELNQSKAFAWVFMFKILSVIYFFSFFISMLFYLGWMQWLVMKIGWALQVTVGTTACESMNAAANIFLGISEAPLMIKPFIRIMTNSELHAVMTGGFATIAGSVLAAYISFGISASHLLSASVMSAPAALSMAKLMYPETKKTKTASTGLPVVKGNEANLLDAASQGAVTAVYLVANIGGTLVAVLAFIAFLNGILGWAGSLVGVQDLTFEYVLGKIFVPLAWLMGVPNQDLDKVGILVGLKTFVNEFAAYDRLATFKADMAPRSTVIATYALCGFSNPASIGIQIASLGTMAPERRGDLAQLAFRAFVAGSMACFLTACVAGMLIDSE